MDKTTLLIHHPYQPPEGYSAPQPGVFKASTIFFPNTKAMRARYFDELGHQYTYGTKGTPTTFLLEERLCTLEGGTYCSLVPSGLAAIALVNFSVLKPGDEVLLPSNVYGPSKVLAGAELSHFGISFASYDAMNPQDLEDKISPKTKLVWLEAPGSITMEFPDLPALFNICKAKGILTALDNTWGAGLAFNPFDFDQEINKKQGVDISIHALTKYPSGGGDVLMGSVITRDAALFKLIKLCHMRMGYHVGVNDIESVLRSLPSLALRYKAHDVAARHLATWLSTRSEVVQVLHPAIEGAPGHDNWKAVCQQGHAAGLFSIMVDAKYSSAQVDAFCDALKHFKLGFSWGGPVSLVVPYDVKTLRGGKLPYTLKNGHLVRFSIGLEAVEDLHADLVQAMDTAFNEASISC
jgi:cysteine-S-conjugate beta-lyase